MVGLTLSGHNHFPFCFGLLNNDTILFEYFKTFHQNINQACPTFAQSLKTGIQANDVKMIFFGVLNGISFMHSKKLLHNDVKSDNVIIANVVKIIDFGKSTLISKPPLYNLVPGSEEQKKYNLVHRHLAHELRNIPGSKQTVLTDTYSIGHMFKHAGYPIKADGIC